MIAKGKIRAEGGKLARYLITGEPGETARLIETRGLETFGGDAITAFAIMERIAEANTRSTLPFFHGHIRLAPGERLSDEQWMEALDRMEKRLGLAGQPRQCLVNAAPAELQPVSGLQYPSRVAQRQSHLLVQVCPQHQRFWPTCTLADPNASEVCKGWRPCARAPQQEPWPTSISKRRTTVRRTMSS